MKCELRPVAMSHLRGILRGDGYDQQTEAIDAEEEDDRRSPSGGCDMIPA